MNNFRCGDLLFLGFSRVSKGFVSLLGKQIASSYRKITVAKPLTHLICMLLATKMLALQHSETLALYNPRCTSA